MFNKIRNIFNFICLDSVSSSMFSCHLVFSSSRQIQKKKISVPGLQEYFMKNNIGVAISSPKDI